jgi:serine/threonine-protein kinase
MGRYEVIKHIATGGMGAVYRARDTENDREVALKVLSKELAAKRNLLVRFQREARSAAKLAHENIVVTYDFGEINGVWYLAMEFIDGDDLHDYVKRNGPLDPEEARQIILQAARALRHADEQNIVHRDIKPSNLLLARKNDRPLVKLTDFGLAREVDADECRVTRAGTTVGTVDYMSPEQARDSSAADIRSDLYSLGSTWYHLLVGHAPFTDGGLGERLIKIMNDEPPDARELNPRVSDETWAVLSRLLAKDRNERYQTPGELIDDLLALEGRAAVQPKRGAKAQSKKKPRKRGSSAADTQTGAAAPTRVKDAEPPMDRKKLRYAAAGAAVVLAVAVAVVAGLSKRSDKRAGNEAPVVDPEGQATDPRAGGEPRDPPEAGKKPQDKDKRPENKGKEPENPAAKGQLPALYKPAAPINVTALRQEVEAPWAGSTQTPANAFVARVSRVPGPAPSFHSLSAACAAAPAGRAIILEIHDNGPIFELPTALAGRDLTVRAAKGYRPLVVWDLPATLSERKRLKKSDQPLVFLRIDKGKLSLEGLELAWRWPEGLAGPAALLDVKDGELSVKDCTVSAAGKPRDGVTLARFRGEREKARCRFTRCLARGAGLVALDLDSPGEALLDGCLFTGGERPMLRVRSGAMKGPRLRVVRSTLVCGRTVLELKPAGPVDRSPALSWLGWDSLLSHNGAGEGGELFKILDGADPDGVEWRSVNCLYAGWKTLLAGGKAVAGDDLRDWQRLWKRIEGDAVVRDPWPDQEFNEPATQPATAYQPAKVVAYASTVAPEQPLGCDLSALPVTRDGWQALSFDPVVSAPEALADASAPDIPNPGDGRFHGARLNLAADVDVGAYLAQMRDRFTFGPRVVLHLAGKGERTTSPIRVKGSTLVLYFEQPADREAPRLALKLGRVSGVGPFIDVEDGSLEVIGGVLRAADLASSRLSHLIQVKGGDVRLYRTWLEGPRQAVPEGYLSAVRLVGAGEAGAEKMRSCSLNECVVLSSRAGIALDGVGGRLLLRQSVVVSGTEALHLLPGPGCKGRAAMSCTLENVTFAGRTAVVRLGDAEEAGAPSEPVVVQARDCAYLNPFPGKPSKAGLLVCEGDALARGLLLWQGEREGFDRRLYFAAAKADAPPDVKEGHAAWKLLWGSSGVREPRPELTTRLLEFDARRWPLERLTLPVRDPPGANLKALGIGRSKKKPR